MFVRTKKGKIFDCVVHEQMGTPIYYPKTSETNGYIDWNEVYKKSENIIDILEVGDYVNGELIHYIERFKDGSTYLCFGEHGTFVDYQIKSIVTREQFKAMEYRLGDK